MPEIAACYGCRMADDSAGTHRNRLANETSPYLLQHASNPVDWYPWGAEALARARAEDKPILLSIGYAACHWCHVMERESFENPRIAEVMNRHFVCIKVDREERPDLDDIYMSATVAMSGHGGWPMTVFLTPDQRPFFAGTYFPPGDQYGRPGFRSLLEQIAKLWSESRQSLDDQATALSERVRAEASAAPPLNVGADAIGRAAGELARAFDPEYGGFGHAPKFPPSSALSLLLRHHRTTGNAESLAMVTRTLDGMKNGGMYDHLGGGFARYSTDERWLVPHFEKMLYDNAQLARVYLEAWQATKDPEYERVARETLDYVIREMQDAAGGYYSATDADSEGVEGKFFVWTPEEVEAVVGAEAAEWFSAYYDVTPAGNWEGLNILNTPRSLDEVARELGTDAATLSRSLDESKKKLYAARSERVPPLLDDKVLTSWNGLMIGAMAEGARVLGEARYLESAIRAARYATSSLRRPDGGLYRTARAGTAHLDAYLEDYAFFADALIDLVEAGGDPPLLDEAARLTERLISDFADDDGGGFFNTAIGHEALLVRTRDGHDGAIPNANAVSARALARLAAHLDRNDFRERAAGTLRAYGRLIERSPRAFATALGVADFLLEGPIELVFAGRPDEPSYQELVRVVSERYLPNRVIAHAVDSNGSSPLSSGKVPVDGKAALYVCRNFACQAPVTDPREAADLVERESRTRSESREHALPVRRLAGHATKEGTERYASRFRSKHGESAFTAFGSTEWIASRFGFGTYRVDDRSTLHRASLEKALANGIQLIDTSSNYGDGHSEQLVGDVLRALADRGTIARDEIIVVTKAGYAQGRNLELAQQREAEGRPFPEMVRYADELWHSIHPAWLEDQLSRSLERLRLDTVDVLLLHNPEYYLSSREAGEKDVEAARAEFQRRLVEAFRHLEEEVRRGRIAAYGVSSNSVVLPASDREATDLARMLEAARTAGGDAHHFRVLELPMNLLESGALTERNTGASGQETVLELSRKNQIAVLVNRPLNAIIGQKLVRLADPPDLPDGPRLDVPLATMRELEKEFASTLAPALRLPEGAGIQPAELFRWADELADIAANVDTVEQWNDIENHALSPAIAQRVLAMNRGLSGALEARWSAWRDRYLPAFEAAAGSIRRRASDRSRARSRILGAALDSVGLASEARPLSQRALLALKSIPGVTSVLVGMRSPEYVADALAVLGTPDTANAERAFSAAAAASLPGI